MCTLNGNIVEQSDHAEESLACGDEDDGIREKHSQQRCNACDSHKPALSWEHGQNIPRIGNSGIIQEILAKAEITEVSAGEIEERDNEESAHTHHVHHTSTLVSELSLDDRDILVASEGKRERRKALDHRERAMKGLRSSIRRLGVCEVFDDHHEHSKAHGEDRSGTHPF